jgi:hypothetical protein
MQGSDQTLAAEQRTALRPSRTYSLTVEGIKHTVTYTPHRYFIGINIPAHVCYGRLEHHIQGRGHTARMVALDSCFDTVFDRLTDAERAQLTAFTKKFMRLYDPRAPRS